VADVTLWSQGVFALSYSYLESLIETLDSVDFAALILSPDDVVVSKSTKGPSPRDNVLFELGLFMGRLGRNRTFFIFDNDLKLRLPSDLLGIAAATYRTHADGNVQAAVGPACATMKKAIRSGGRRPRLLTAIAREARSDVSLPDLSGLWDGRSSEGPMSQGERVTLEVRQRGAFVQATVTRETGSAIRIFEYEGRFTSGQLVLFFEEKAGRGFIVGTMVLYLSGDLSTLAGRTTYYHHTKKAVVSDVREFLRRHVSAGGR